MEQNQIKISGLSCIYKIWFEGAELTTDGNPKLYIGLTSGYKGRRAGHLRGLRIGKHNNPYLQNLFDKYGETAYRIDIIEVCEKNNNELLAQREIYWIDLFKTTDRNYGYNLRPGGFTCNPSEETRQKLRVANLGKKTPPHVIEKLRQINLGQKRSPEQKLKMSLAMKGRKIYTEEDKVRISERMKGNQHGKGKKMPEATRAGLQKALKGNQHGKGRKMSQEALDKRSLKRKGKPLPKWSEERRAKFNSSGFKHSEETKRKIAEASKKMWKENPLTYTPEQRQAAREKQLGKKLS